MAKRILAVIGLAALLFAPVYPVQHRVVPHLTRSGHTIFAVEARRLPFGHWTKLLVNADTPEYANDWITWQTHWMPLFALEIGEWLPVTAAPLPLASPR